MTTIKRLLQLSLITLCAATLIACASTPQKKIEYLFLKKAGEQLPLSEVVDIDGNKIDLTNPNKRKLVILFATWCSDSQRALTALSKSDLLEDNELEIVAIAREQSEKEIRKFQEERNFSFQMVTDEKRELYSIFANAGIPRFIMVGKDNLIIDHVVAEGDNQLSKIHWNKK